MHKPKNAPSFLCFPNKNIWTVVSLSSPQNMQYLLGIFDLFLHSIHRQLDYREPSYFLPWNFYFSWVLFCDCKTIFLAGWTYFRAFDPLSLPTSLASFFIFSSQKALLSWSSWLISSLQRLSQASHTSLRRYSCSLIYLLDRGWSIDCMLDCSLPSPIHASSDWTMGTMDHHLGYLKKRSPWRCQAHGWWCTIGHTDLGMIWAFYFAYDDIIELLNIGEL